MLTTLYLPDDPDALLAETRITALLDARVGEVAVELAPDLGGRPYDPQVESPEAFAVRAWRRLLPSSESGDALDFRLTYGWSLDECRQIIGLLQAIQAELRRQAPSVILEGTRTTLFRDAEEVGRLAERWA